MRKLLLVGLLMALAACSSSSPTTTLPSVVGVWSVQSGSEVLKGLDGSSLKFIELAGNGTGKFYATQATSNVLACVPLVYSVSSKSVISISSIATGVNFNSVELYTFEKASDSSLKLSNKEGQSQNFSLVSAVADSSKCETANVTNQFTRLAINFSYWSNLINDGTNLKVVDTNNVLRTLNPTNAAIVLTQTIPSTVGQYSQISAMQGSDYWANCGCGNVEDIKRFNSAFTLVDTVNTRTDLGNQIVIYSAAFDGTNLWLGGPSNAAGTFRILQVDANAEPDVLVSSFDFPTTVQGMTFLGSQMWGLVNLVGPRLIQINPTTKKATRTITLPTAADGTYRGLTALGGKLYVLIRNNDNTSTILVVQP